MIRNSMELTDLRKNKSKKYLKYTKVAAIAVGLIIIILSAKTNFIDETLTTPEIGEKIEKSKVFEIKDVLQIDYLNDYRFDGIVNYIDEIYATGAADTRKTQDIFIIKSSKPNIVKDHLNDYVNSIKTDTDRNSQQKNKEIESTIVGIKNDVVYLVSANNKEKIEKIIKRYL